MARKLNQDTRTKILKSVEKLISTKGVNAFSLRDVCHECSISPGTLYYFYPTKDDLIYSLIVTHMDEIEKDYLSWLSHHKSDLNAKRFLEIVFYKGTKLFDRAKMHIFVINECLKSNETLRIKYNELWERWFAHLVDGVRQAFPNEEDHETLAYILMFVIDGLVIQEVLHTKTIDIDKLVNYFWKIENEKNRYS